MDSFHKVPVSLKAFPCHHITKYTIVFFSKIRQQTLIKQSVLIDQDSGTVGIASRKYERNSITDQRRYGLYHKKTWRLDETSSRPTKDLMKHREKI